MRMFAKTLAQYRTINDKIDASHLAFNIGKQNPLNASRLEDFGKGNIFFHTAVEFWIVVPRQIEIDVSKHIRKEKDSFNTPS